MHNLTIEIRKIVKVNFSADQWELYTNSYPRDEIENIADALNNALQDYVNNDYTIIEARGGMHNVMCNYKEYGAYDSEPRALLEQALAEIYK